MLTAFSFQTFLPVCVVFLVSPSRTQAEARVAAAAEVGGEGRRGLGHGPNDIRVVCVMCFSVFFLCTVPCCVV